MLDKTKAKEKRKQRRTWNGYYSRLTPTKRGKDNKNKSKYKKKGWEEE